MHLSLLTSIFWTACCGKLNNQSSGCRPKCCFNQSDSPPHHDHRFHDRSSLSRPSTRSLLHIPSVFVKAPVDVMGSKERVRALPGSGCSRARAQGLCVCWTVRSRCPLPRWGWSRGWRRSPFRPHCRRWAAPTSPSHPYQTPPRSDCETWQTHTEINTKTSHTRFNSCLIIFSYNYCTNPMFFRCDKIKYYLS